MLGKLSTVRLRPVLVALAMLVAAVQSGSASGQSFVQSLFGKGDAPPEGYFRPQEPAFSPFGGLFSPYRPNHRFESPPPDRTTYRTLCVRMCDGFYFPISFSTTSASFTRDAEKCAASCGEDARLFYHANPGGEVEGMIDLTGRAYGSYPIAFRYRKTLVRGCQCRPQPWSEAERARHRGYASANINVDAAVQDKASPAQVAGYQQDALPAPQPIDRSGLEHPDNQSFATPPSAGAPPTVMAAKGNLSPIAQPAPITRQKQMGGWNWFTGVPATGLARRGNSFSVR